MSTFTVRVRTGSTLHAYTTVGTDSASVHMAAIDAYGVCAVTVVPAAQ